MRFRFILAAAGFLAASLAAHADNVQTYVAYASLNDYLPQTSGEYVYTVDKPITGTATFDLDTGYILDVTLPLDGTTPGTTRVVDFYNVTSPDYPYFYQDCSDTFEYTCLSSGQAEYPSTAFFDFNFSNPGEEIYQPDGSYDLQDQYGTGTLGAPISATPEPSTFALLGTGLLGVAGVMKRRFS